MSHYYTEKPDVISNPNVYKTKIFDKTFEYKTDNGVFCKDYLDFGSRLLLNTVLIPEIDGDILDLGCGYGAMGIALSSITDKEILMCDVNERAIDLANENIKLNGAKNISAIKSNIYTNITKNFALIITNPPIRAGKQVVFEFFTGAYSHLNLKGEIWVVIQKKQGAPSAIKKLEEIFGNCSVMSKDKGYYILKSVKTE